jgi:dUTP pyrophosphatase
VKKNRILFKKLSETARIPTYQSTGAAGFDFYADHDATLEAGRVTIISTGLAVEIPDGYEIQVRARSGLSAKMGIFLVNGVGTIDSDYRGEVKIIMSTCMRGPLEIKAGDRIAQGVLNRVEQADLFEVQLLSASDRGEGGLGSTGLK